MEQKEGENKVCSDCSAWEGSMKRGFIVVLLGFFF